MFGFRFKTNQMTSFYKKFIKPAASNSYKEREVVLNYLLLGIIGLSLAALIDTLLELDLTRTHYLLSRIFIILVSILLVGGLYMWSRRRQHQLAVASILVAAITLAVSLMFFRWGILLPTGILMSSLVVVTAGILIGSRYSLYLAALLTLLMAVLQFAQSAGVWHPDLSWIKINPTPGDIIGFGAILFTIALVSWLFNRQMEDSLARALKSEKALERQKDVLEEKVQKRARQIETAQLEKMQQMYRFAELGRLSTALFHDLANHLSTVSVDIEGLKENQQSEIMQRIHRNVSHIDDIVQRVRQQMRGKTNVEVFSVIDEIKEVINILSFNAGQTGVQVLLEPGNTKSSLLYKGDLIRFRQLLMNLISNSIEAYPPAADTADRERSVIISLERQQTNLIIKVIDRGVGITPARQVKIFDPFYSTKERGVGIGLFVAKQVTEDDFQGTLSVYSQKSKGTTFVVTLPKSYYAKRNTY